MLTLRSACASLLCGLAFGAALSGCSAFFEDATPKSSAAGQASVYELSVQDLEGNDVPLQRFRGQVALIVNTASKCGFTPQYEGLQELYERFQGEGFVVLGFPSGDFRNQEFENPAEIRAFCTDNYSVTFPLFARTGVQAGEGQSALYAQLGAATGVLPGWNFGKYLIARDGTVLQFFDTKTAPQDPDLVAALETALAETP